MTKTGGYRWTHECMCTFVKTVTEMGGLREERFARSGRGMRDGGVEMVVKVISVRRTIIDERYWCQPHPGLQG